MPALPVAAALLTLAFDNGGFFSGAWATAAVGLFWFAGLVLVLSDRVELSVREVAWLGLIAGFLAWTALSLAWSINHDEPLLELRRGLVYLAGVAAVFIAGTRRSTAYVLGTVWASTCVVVVYALARYLLWPDLRSDVFQVNLLFRPVGYANALGIFAGMALIVALVEAARAPTAVLRALASASTAPLAAAVALTSSRASALAVVIGLAVVLALDEARATLAARMAVIAPVLAAIVALCEHSGLTDPTRDPAHVRSQGRLLAVWIAIGAGVLAAAPRLAERAGSRVASMRRPSFRVVAAVAVAVAALVGVLASGAIHRFFTTGYRPTYWHVAWVEYKDHPALGAGGGTFADYWLRYGDPTLQGGALDAHNLYLETLAEVGPIGVLLLAATLAYPLAVAVRARRHPLAAGAVGAYVAFLAHAALDWDWEMPVVTLAAMTCAACVFLAAREVVTPPVRLTPLGRTAALVLIVGLALFALAGEVLSGLGGKFH